MSTKAVSDLLALIAHHNEHATAAQRARTVVHLQAAIDALVRVHLDDGQGFAVPCNHVGVPPNAAELNRQINAAAAPGEVVINLGGGAVRCPDCWEWVDLQPPTNDQGPDT